MRDPEGKDYWSTGTFREIMPIERLVYTDSFADEHGNAVSGAYYGMGDDFPMEMLVTIMLEDLGARTRMTLRHAGMPAGEMGDMAEAGERVLGWRPDEMDYAHPNVGEDDCGGQQIVNGAWYQVPHLSWFFYLARLCNHCTYPACLASCPRGSIYKRPEDGIVLIDQERCRGYRKCVEACPYKKTLYRGTTRTSEKCIACFPRIEGRDPQGHGLPMQTRCMAACVGHIRLQGLVQMNKDGTWKEDRYNPLSTWSTSPRSPCRSTRSSAPSPTATTYPRAGCHGITSNRCSVRVSMKPSTATVIRTASCSLSCSSSVARTASSFAMRSKRGQKSTKPRCAAARSACTTTR